MKLTKCNIEDLGGRVKCFANTRNQSILEEFINSDMDCAKIIGWKHINADSCSSSLNASIRRFKFANIRATSIKGEVYLIKTDKVLNQMES